jgi:hypothetical protein
MDTLIALIAAPIVLIVGIAATYRRPSRRPAFGTLQVTRRKRSWNEGALAERAAERLRG